jgi:hypothetical protein
MTAGKMQTMNIEAAKTPAQPPREACTGVYSPGFIFLVVGLVCIFGAWINDAGPPGLRSAVVRAAEVTPRSEYEYTSVDAGEAETPEEIMEDARLERIVEDGEAAGGAVYREEAEKSAERSPKIARGDKKPLPEWYRREENSQVKDQRKADLNINLVYCAQDLISVAKDCTQAQGGHSMQGRVAMIECLSAHLPNSVVDVAQQLTAPKCIAEVERGQALLGENDVADRTDTGAAETEYETVAELEYEEFAEERAIAKEEEEEELEEEKRREGGRS